MNQIKKTITTVEIAGMMGVNHWEILRKLDGQEKKGKHIKGFVEILNDNEVVVVDYFIKSTYIDVKGEERPCYEVTKLGCDFLANKFTGEKGILFTARYVKKFNEMENEGKQTPYEPKATSVGEIASYIKEMHKVMYRQDSKPYEIAFAFKLVSEQFGILLPDKFVKIPEYEQLTLSMGLNNQLVTHS